MKSFNIGVVALFLVVFGLSTNANPVINGVSTFTEQVIFEINFTLQDYVMGFDHTNHNLFNSDGKLTVMYLQNIFLPLCWIMLALNVAYYAGRGDIGKFLRAVGPWLKSWRKAPASTTEESLG